MFCLCFWWYFSCFLRIGLLCHYVFLRCCLMCFVVLLCVSNEFSCFVLTFDVMFWWFVIVVYVLGLCFFMLFIDSWCDLLMIYDRFLCLLALFSMFFIDFWCDCLMICDRFLCFGAVFFMFVIDFWCDLLMVCCVFSCFLMVRIHDYFDDLLDEFWWCLIYLYVFQWCGYAFPTTARRPRPTTADRFPMFSDRALTVPPTTADAFARRPPTCPPTSPTRCDVARRRDHVRRAHGSRPAQPIPQRPDSQRKAPPHSKTKTTNCGPQPSHDFKLRRAPSKNIKIYQTSSKIIKQIIKRSCIRTIKKHKKWSQIINTSHQKSIKKHEKSQPKNIKSYHTSSKNNIKSQ